MTSVSLCTEISDCSELLPSTSEHRILTLPFYTPPQVEEYEHKLKSLEDLCNPIITRMYQGAGGGGAGGPPPSGGGEGGGAGPKIEEVD